MKNNKSCKQELDRFSLCASVLMCLAIHGYRFANTMFSHDAMVTLVQNDAAWEIALGRFFQPVLVFMRGNLCVPWLLCLLQTVWLSSSVYLLAKLLKLQGRAEILATAGVVIGSEAFIICNASFLAYSDLYAFALCASIFGVWCVEKGGISYSLLGIGSITASLATYQAYVSVAIALMLILALVRLCDFSIELKKVLQQLVYYMVILVFSAVVYYVAWQVIRLGLGIWVADGYNGMASLGRYAGKELSASVLAAYKKVFVYFFQPSVMANMTFRDRGLQSIWKYAVISINLIVMLVCACAIACIFYRQARRLKPQRRKLLARCLLTVLLLVLFPLACNFVCVMSKGMEHTLMLFGPALLYMLAIVMAGKIRWKASFNRFRLLQKMTATGIVTLLLGIVVWVHFIYANQIYFKKALQENAASFLLSRIVSDVEDIPGYVPGTTPVAISGYFEESSYLPELRGFEELVPDFMGKTSLTYQGVDYAMLQYYLNINMNLIRVDASSEAIQEMPNYPKEGSVAMIDGVIIVKISN